MGLIVKKDESEHEFIDGIEIIERSDTPDDLPENPIELTQGDSAEDIAKRKKRSHKHDAAADGKGKGSGTGSDGNDDDGSDDNGGNGSDDGPDTTQELDSSSDGPVEPNTSGHKYALSQTPRSVKIGGVVVMLVIAVVAAVAGYVVGNGGLSETGTGSATIDEDQLDTVVATYTYDGATHEITARDAIESEYSLETAQNDDGTYSIPSSETIIQLVRNNILVDEAESRGIELTDDELEEYAEDMVGTSDYEELASEYGVTEDQAEEIVRENALIQKLYDQVVPEASELEAPTEPTAPEDDDTSTSSAAYAEYIIELAGDEWDSDAGTWASTDGEYYAAIGDDFDGETATYEQAISAYYVAYQDYSEEATEISNTYRAYVNELYANANIRLYGLYV